MSRFRPGGPSISQPSPKSNTTSEISWKDVGVGVGVGAGVVVVVVVVVVVGVGVGVRSSRCNEVCRGQVTVEGLGPALELLI